MGAAVRRAECTVLYVKKTKKTNWVNTCAKRGVWGEGQRPLLATPRAARVVGGEGVARHGAPWCGDGARLGAARQQLPPRSRRWQQRPRARRRPPAGGAHAVGRGPARSGKARRRCAERARLSPALSLAR